MRSDPELIKTGDASDWAESTGATQVLLRSRIEIVKLLRAAIAAALPVVACLRGEEGIFVSRLRGLSADGKYVLMDFGDYKAANGALLAVGNASLSLDYKHSYIEFLAEHAVEDFDTGVAAIRFDFPKTLSIKQRRSHRRIALIPSVPLSCLADGEGIMPFHADVIDVGIGGLGVMVYATAIRLAPETLLKGCTIALPDASSVTVDIVIRHAADIVQFGGRPAYRAGCRFLGTSDAIRHLVGVFLLDLERREAEY